jgi:hypothetical protein
MIYNTTKIIESAEQLVGFDSTDNFTLSPKLTTKMLTMNAYHPFLQLDILDNIRPEGQTLSNWLLSVRKNSTLALINDVITKKLMKQSLKNVLGETSIFDSTARFTNFVSKNDRFVGWIFRPIKSNGLYTKIKNIALQLLQPQQLDIYVFHSSDPQPIQIIPLNFKGNTAVDWVTLDEPIILNYDNFENDRGGFYYIGYFEEDLTANNFAIYKDHDLSKAPCGTCNMFNTKAHNTWSKWISIGTGFSPRQNTIKPNLSSVETINIENKTNYGLNFRIESYCDITKFLEENLSIIAPTLQVRYAIDLIRYIEMSALRKNSVTDSMKEEAFVAINGNKSENNFIKVRGLIHDYEDYVNGLNFDMSKLDPVCLPKMYRSISYR